MADKEKKEKKVKISLGGSSPRGLEGGLKKRTILTLGGGLAAILFLVVVTLPGEKKKEAPPASLSLEEKGVGEAAWQARAQAQLNTARKAAQSAARESHKLGIRLNREKDRNDKLEADISDLKKLFKQRTRALESGEYAPPAPQKSVNEAKAPPPPAQGNTNLPPPPPLPPGSVRAHGKALPPPNEAARTPIQGGGNQASVQTRKPFIFSPELPESAKKDDDLGDQEYKKNPFAGYLPAGSFAKAVLLTGLDAGASKQTQANPQPVLLRIQGEAVTPGDASYDLSQCFIIGSGYGDISAERAYIRIARLSCVDAKDGTVLETDLNGYIADSDGFQGMRGKVVRRNGQLIAKSLLAGFAQGISKVGEAASQAASQRITSPSIGGSGTTTNTVDINAGDLAKAGAFGGASNAADQLAKFYLDEAKSIFPVVSVPPGRKVTVVITEGSALHWSSYKGQYVKKTDPGSIK